MSLKLNKTAIVDTGFWFALLDKSDAYYESAQNEAETLLSMYYVVPWPVLYETLNTKLVRNQFAIRQLDSILKRPNALFLEDQKYRSDALSVTFSDFNRGRSLSLADNVLRLIVEDDSIKVSCIFTFNSRDFFDVCNPRGVDVIPSMAVI